MVLRTAISEAAAKTVSLAGPAIHRSGLAPRNQERREGSEQDQGVAVRGEPEGRVLPFQVAGLDGTGAIAQHDLDDAEPVGVERRGEEGGDGDEPELALALHRTAAQALDEGFAAIGAEHHPTEEVAAMAIGPEDEHCDERPHPAAAFQNRHGESQQDECDEEGTALLEVDGHGAGGNGCHEAAVEPAGAPPDHESHQPAEGDEERGAHQHQAGKSTGTVDEVHEDLGQPLVGEVEVACCGLSGVGGAREAAGVAERVRDGKGAGFESVASGHQVEPDIGVGHLAGEPGEEQESGESEEERTEPRGRRGSGGSGGRGTAGRLPGHLGNPSLPEGSLPGGGYSERKACMTSTRAARAAGKAEAMTAAASSTRTEPATGAASGIWRPEK